MINLLENVVLVGQLGDLFLFSVYYSMSLYI